MTVLSRQGKVALVTGAASGIGRATAARLAEAGFRVALTDVDPAGRQVAEALPGSIYIEHDVTDESAWERAIQSVLDAYGRLDVLVNNAGIGQVNTGLGRAGPITETTLDDWRWVMAVNLDAVFLGTKHGVRAMRRHGDGGSIVNVTSAMGLIGSPFLSAYCASKGAVTPLTKTAALECADEGIRVNAVLPGPVRTPIWDKLGVPAKGQAAVAADSPLGRMAEPEELADAILYLASDASRYVTGSQLLVDGGLTAGRPVQQAPVGAGSATDD
jgi:3(or 17)beta-hydroxysteroid dehydrogenase